ncbi:MAG: TonB-dependent receptor [Acidobacteria bacterium]|nr:TonB-dependent receptor [Acidobacteriota bacterium]
MKRVAFSCGVLLLLAGLGTPAQLLAAQGTRTGILTGNIRDAQGLTLPGVAVTARSPALLGARTTVSGTSGIYQLRGLPPGEYSVQFELGGMKPVEEKALVELGRETALDVRMSVEGVQEQITVTAETPSVVRTTSGGANYVHKEIDTLPTGRTLVGIANLAPGLTNNTPNANQVTISGAFAYDNVFLVDGVDINDNLFGSPHALFIEDAIQETQILTSGIPAEYGRFSGGVVNAITRSGGNSFSGSFRVNGSNPSWAGQNPFEKSSGTARSRKINFTFEGTFGGPISRDRLWFFTAGRSEKTTQTVTLSQTGQQFDDVNTNRRGEIKLTGTVRTNHTVFGSFVGNPSDRIRRTFDFTIDKAGIIHPEFPNRGLVAGYRGVIRRTLFAEAQYSQKTLEFRDFGGTSTTLVDSPFFTASQQLGHYNAPYFDTSDPEQRNNRQITGSLSWFLGGKGVGSHDLKGGVELFRSQRTGGNSQSPTGYAFDADYLTDGAGRPIYDSNGFLIPVFIFGESLIEQWVPVKGATLNITTTSLYLQDRWAPTSRLSFDLGVRYERVRGKATGDLVTADTNTIVPRLAASLDARGNGRYVVQATYGHYSGKYSEAQFGTNTNVGNPNGLFGVYVGPNGQGRGFAPGFSPSNYLTVDGSFPTANVFFDKGLSSPITREFSAALGVTLRKGFLKGQFLMRDMKNFVEDFISLSTGATTVVRNGVNFGTFQNRLYQNTDDPKRYYKGIVFQGRYDLKNGWAVHGHWTMQVDNNGNFEGEATNQPGISSVLGDYPQAFTKARHFPEGRLNDFQRHKGRVWTIYSLGLGRMGDADLAALYRYDSPLTFSYVATNVGLSVTQRTRLANYATRPTSQAIFFGARGAGEFNPSHLVDVAATYTLPRLSLVRSARPWVKFEARNLFNRAPLIGFNTTVTPDPLSPRDELGLPTGYLKGPRFGQGTASGHYPTPRTYLVYAGIRF